MALLAEVSPLVEQVSVDEAYVDLAAVPGADLTVEGVSALAQVLRQRIRTATGGRPRRSASAPPSWSPRSPPSWTSPTA